MLDDPTCFLLFFHVLYSRLLEAVAILRDAKGLYHMDLGLVIAAFFGNLVAAVVLIRLFGLPGSLADTIIGTIFMYVCPYMIWLKGFHLLSPCAGNHCGSAGCPWHFVICSCTIGLELAKQSVWTHSVGGRHDGNPQSGIPVYASL